MSLFDYESEVEYRHQAYRQAAALERIIELLEKQSQKGADIDQMAEDYRECHQRMFKAEVRVAQLEAQLGLRGVKTVDELSAYIKQKVSAVTP